MSLYTDILISEFADDDDIKQDDNGTWTVIAWELDNNHIPNIPTKDLALAIVRAIRAGYGKGVDAARYS